MEHERSLRLSVLPLVVFRVWIFTVYGVFCLTVYVLYDIEPRNILGIIVRSSYLE